MPAATVGDVATSLGRPITSDAEQDQIQMWLSDAEMQIGLRLGDVTLLDQAVLAFVEREAVALKVRNPDGKVSEGIDDYTYRRNDNAAAGQVLILDEWWAMLNPAAAVEGNAFSITAGGDPSWSRPVGVEDFTPHPGEWYLR